MIIEALGSLLFLCGLLAIAVSITAVDEHRQRQRARELSLIHISEPTRPY